MKRKFTFLLMALLTLAGFKSWGQETLTVCEGTTAEQIVPVFVNYFDSEGTISQYVIPSSELTAMTGGGITALKFYISYVDATTLPSVLSSAQVTCKLQEVSSAVVSSIQSGGTQVFSGNLTASNSCQELDCIFDNAYTYQGGNLLVSFEVTDDGSFTWTQFFGINPGYNSAITNRGSDPNVPQKFIPKTTFTYSSCIAPTGLAASNVTATGATISWTGNGAENYDLAYGVASTFNLENPLTYTVQNTTATSVQLSGLTTDTEYKCAVKAHCSDEEESAWSAVYSFTPTAKMTLTVNEGNTYNEYVPFYGYYADNLTKSQFIIPATTLSAMEGADISAMEFYTTTSGTNQGPANYSFGGSWDVYFKIVDHVEMPSSYEPLEGMDKVYTGNMVIANNKMTLTFAEPYTYEGGNLMICFNQTASTDYKHTYWKGVTTGPTAAYAGYGSNNYNHRNYYFLPTTTFTYTSGASCPKPKDLAVSNITATGATISWTSSAESYDVAYGVASTFDLSDPSTYTPQSGLTTTSVQLSGLTAETEYKCAVKAHCSGEDESDWSNAVSFTPSNKKTLTVNDGTDVYDKAPFYGDNAYYYTTKSQFVIPASYMEDMQGCEITQLKFFVNSSSSYYPTYTSHRWDIYAKEMDDPSGDWWDFYDFGTMTKVYSGSVSIVNNELTITLDEPFQYNNKSLMIGFNQTNTGFYGVTHWLGSNNTSGSAGGSRCRAGWQSGNQYETKPFLPKTTFTYIPGGERYTVTVDNAITGGSISANPTEATAGTVVNLSATPAFGYEFGAWVEDYEDVTIEDNQFTMPEHDVTISATFNELTQYNINCAELTEGTIHAEYNGVTISEAPAGTEITLVAEANPGYSFDHFTVDDEPLPGNTFVMPESDVTVSAVFSPVYNISIDMALVGGSISQMSTQGTLTAYPAGTQVFLFASPDEDYSFQENSFTVIRSDGEIGPTVTYTNMMYSFIMPESNVTVSATFNKTAFAVSQVITPTYSGCSFYVSKTAHVGIGEIVTLSNFNAYEGYYFDFEDVNSLVVKRNDNQETVEVNNYGNIYQFAMPISDVTVTATFKDLPRYSVFVGDVVNGTITLDNPYQDIWAGAIVYFEVEPETGYTLESITVTPVEGDPFEPTQQSWYYYFTMPSSNVTISATFRQLQSYTINYYVNGELDRTMQCREDGLVNNDGPQNVAVPAGMTFEGWGVAEIGTYVTEKPTVLGNAESPTQNCDLYAVLRYTESVPAGSKDGDKWVKVTDANDLQAGDEIIFIGQYNSANYTLSQRSDIENTYYERSSVPVSISNNEITNLPSETVIFTLSANNENWSLNYYDNFHGETSLAEYYGEDYYNTTWYAYATSEWVMIQNGSSVNTYPLDNNEYNRNYRVSLYAGKFKGYFGTDYAAQVYKKQPSTITTNYYMTSVLADGEVAENTTAKNIVITTGTVTVDNNIVLTMNENGLFRNKDAANFVFGYGAQLITDNAGVLATMKKHINGIEWYTISSPLAASVNVTDVTNLIPGNNIAAKTYDLYRLNEAEGIWENARPETGANPAFTTIDKGCGYIYANNAGADHIAFAGEINVADVECNLTNGAAHGFNLIGNPFLQNIKLTDVTGVTLADGFYVLTNQNTWGTMIEAGTIAPLQGFLVQVDGDGGTATISKPTSSSKGERSHEQNTNIEMIVSNASFKDNAYAMFGEGIGLNKVSHRNAQAPMLYVPQDGEDFAIAFMDENTTVFPVSFKAMTTGSYSISLKPTDDVSTLVLVDNMTGVETNMLLEDSYTFIGSPADNENRFTVKLTISNSQDEDEHFAYQNGSELVINGEGTLQIFDILGRVVVSEEVHGQTVNVGSLNTGAYIVRLTGESVKTQKIVVR